MRKLTNLLKLVALNFLSLLLLFLFIFLQCSWVYLQYKPLMNYEGKIKCNNVMVMQVKCWVTGGVDCRWCGAPLPGRVPALSAGELLQILIPLTPQTEHIRLNQRHTDTALPALMLSLNTTPRVAVHHSFIKDRDTSHTFKSTSWSLSYEWFCSCCYFITAECLKCTV